MMHFQEIIVHTAVTLKQIAIPLYIFASELHPIKAVTSRDIVTLVKYSLQGTTQGRYLTGGVPPVRFSM